MRNGDLYVLSLEPHGQKAVDLDKIKPTNYNQMSHPSAITLQSLRTTVRTLRSWQGSTKAGAEIEDAAFKPADRAMTGSSAVFTLCSFVSEATRFNSLRQTMGLLLEQPAVEGKAARSVPVDGPYLNKIQCWSDASETYFQYAMVQDGWKIVTNPTTAPKLPPPPGKPPGPLPPPAASDLPQWPMTPLGELLIKDIAIVKLPRKTLDPAPPWHGWTSKKLPQLWN